MSDPSSFNLASVINRQLFSTSPRSNNIPQGADAPVLPNLGTDTVSLMSNPADFNLGSFINQQLFNTTPQPNSGGDLLGVLNKILTPLPGLTATSPPANTAATVPTLPTTPTGGAPDDGVINNVKTIIQQILTRIQQIETEAGAPGTPPATGPQTQPAAPAAPATAATPAPAPATNDPVVKAENWVNSLYERILGRTPTEVNRLDWRDQLVSGKLDEAGVIKGFFNSPEYKAQNHTPEDTVNKLYEVILGRTPDPEGFKFWTNAVKNGASLSRIIDDMMKSAEFTGKQKQLRDLPFTVKTPVTAATARPGAAPPPPPAPPAPNPEPAPAENKPATGGAAPQASKEQAQADHLYNSVLGRDANETDRNNAANVLKTNPGSPELVKHFFNSEEYKAKEKSKEEQVNDIYKAVLNREADGEGMQTWKSELEKGASVDEVIQKVMNSEEFKNQNNAEIPK